ncbi:tetratricopeptide repeat protein [Tateyamaria sp.]|uniref:tetratricopeptide repeat protein n=1 Tax=Tateyamaria sp. TaxID=1929288 RepID=UPI00329C631B
MKQVFGASALAVLLTFGGQTVSAQDFGKGLEAAQVGDFETALREWQPLADQGSASAQVMLGWMYDNGRGVPQDYADAAKWYRLAAEQGDADAQFSLSTLYDNGQGVGKDNL